MHLFVCDFCYHFTAKRSGDSQRTNICLYCVFMMAKCPAGQHDCTSTLFNSLQNWCSHRFFGNILNAIGPISTHLCQRFLFCYRENLKENLKRPFKKNHTHTVLRADQLVPVVDTKREDDLQKLLEVWKSSPHRTSEGNKASPRVCNDSLINSN